MVPRDEFGGCMIEKGGSPLGATICGDAEPIVEPERENDRGRAERQTDLSAVTLHGRNRHNGNKGNNGNDSRLEPSVVAVVAVVAVVSVLAVWGQSPTLT